MNDPARLEITPAMVKVGVDALSERYLDLEGGLAAFPDIVRSVFARMSQAKLPPSVPEPPAELSE